MFGVLGIASFVAQSFGVLLPDGAAFDKVEVEEVFMGVANVGAIAGDGSGGVAVVSPVFRKIHEYRCPGVKRNLGVNEAGDQEVLGATFGNSQPYEPVAKSDFAEGVYRSTLLVDLSW